MCVWKSIITFGFNHRFSQMITEGWSETPRRRFSYNAVGRRIVARTETVSIDELKAIARRVRRHIVQMVASVNSGHPGGSLSGVEIVTALYFRVMRHDPQKPLWPERDRLVISKGHATPLVYGVLAEAGYFPVGDLASFRKLGGKLQGHTVMQKPPGVEMTAGA